MGFSRGFAVIVAKQSTQALAAMNRTLGREWRKLRLDDLILQSLMVSFLMIMKNELRCRTVEAGLPDQHHPVQTGFLDAPDKTLGDGIQIRGARRQSHRFHASSLKDHSEGLAEYAGPIMNEITAAAQKPVEVLIRRTGRILEPKLNRPRSQRLLTNARIFGQYAV